jgi:PAS domain S-box-containing protein
LKSNNKSVTTVDSATETIFLRAAGQNHSGQISSGVEESVYRILEMLPGFVWIAGPDGELEYLSQSILDYAGMTFEELKEHWSSILHPADIEARMQAAAEGLRTGNAVEHELRMLRSDGVYRWFHSRTRALRDEQGNVIRWYGITWDIEERKQAEEAAHKSKRELRLIIDTIPALVCTAKPDGGVDYLSPRIVDHFGVPAEDLYESGWVQIMHPDDADAAMREWMHSVESGKAFEATYRLRCADGQYRWFQARTEPLRDNDGHILRWYGFLSDIDDQKRVEEALRESENNFRQIIDTIPAFVFRTAPSGELDYVNRRVVEYTGISSNDAAEWGWTQFVHPDDRDAALRKRRSCIEKGRSYENVHRFRRADGQYRWFQIRAEPLRDKDGRVAHWYGLFFDIDDRKKAEEIMRTTRARLSLATQITTVAELSAAIAHEINQPLAAIIHNAHALSRWLSNEPPDLERAQLIAERIIRDGNSTAGVVRRIRALFQEAAPTKEPLDINQVITDVLALERDELLKKGITVETELEQNLALTLGDAIQIRQVIINLVQNAVDAMESVRERSRLLSICSGWDGINIVVEIRDQGTGMENIEKAFEPFFTTKEKGMGMGLAICRSIIEAHEGHLSATTSAQGTTFCVTLPIRQRNSNPDIRLELEPKLLRVLQET